MCPGDHWEVEQATRDMVGRPGVTYFRLDKSTAPPSHREGEVFSFGRMRKIADGSDATLIATGGILGEAVKAAAMLQSQGIAARVLSCHTIKPLDVDAILDASRQTGGIVTVEEHTVDGGLGGAVAEALLEAGGRPGFFARVGLRSGFSSIVGSQQYLRSVYGLDAESIVKAVTARLKGTPAGSVHTRGSAKCLASAHGDAASESCETCKSRCRRWHEYETRARYRSLSDWSDICPARCWPSSQRRYGHRISTLPFKLRAAWRGAAERFPW